MDRTEVHQILNQIIHDRIYPTNKGFNFRCPICMDSQKHKNKRRGWVLFGNNNRITFYCHNGDCNANMSFKNFVKTLNKEVYDKYFRKKELVSPTILSIEAKIVEEVKKDINEIIDVSKYILPVSFSLLELGLKEKSLKKLQIKALREVLRRKIPKEYYDDFRVCYEKYSDEYDYSNRLIIPYFDDKKMMYAFQGRTLEKDRIPKYKTFCLNNTKIFNYFVADPSKPVIITEGPLDSLFIWNSISSSGKIGYNSDVFKEIKKKFPNIIWMFDNFYIDKTGAIKAIEFVENNENVFIWPKEWKKYKDANETVIVKNLTSKDITNIIMNNIGTGIETAMKIKMLV